MLTSQEFYHNDGVTRRILEYCGVPIETAREFSWERNNLGNIANTMTSQYISGWGRNLKERFGKEALSFKKENIGELIDGGNNLFRALWDTNYITFFFDVEYVCNRDPKRIYTHSKEIFWQMEPVYCTIKEVFNQYGIKPMTIATGQGYHFVFQVPWFCPETRELVNIGYLEDTVKGKYQHLTHKRDIVVSDDEGRAFDGTGKVLEFIAQDVISRLNGFNIPVGIGDLVPGNEKREMINLDLSSYPDPLHLRVMRTAFSTHDKHRKKGLILPVMVATPRYTPCNEHEIGIDEIFHNRIHFEHSAEYANAITCSMPWFGNEFGNLMRAYKSSDLFRFHQDFDATGQEHHSKWPETYDRFDTRQLPDCIKFVLENPNPNLLQPAQIQALVRVLTGKGWWHPSHVAGLIRSKYERGNWEYEWRKYDANRHARVWTRIYSGMIATGLDQRTDQNCLSRNEQGLCTSRNCKKKLEFYK